MKIVKRIASVIFAMIMVLSINIFAVSADYQTNTHDECCGEIQETSDAEITPMGTCDLGHWFSSTDYSNPIFKHTGGTACYVLYGFNKYCNNCGANTGFVESSRKKCDAYGINH